MCSGALGSRAATLHEIAHVVARPDAAHALFGAQMGVTLEEQLDALQTSYRKLVLLVHPDRNAKAVVLATSTLQRVNVLRDQREAEIRADKAPALLRSRRADTGSIVRTRPAPVVVDDDYDDTEPPPLPACACTAIARATLPGRVVFCSRGGSDWAVRSSDQRAVQVEHTWECSRYRQGHPTTISECGIVLQETLFSHHMPGWCWVHARLKQQPERDYFRDRST